MTTKLIEIPSAICNNSNLGCSPFKIEAINWIAPQELIIPPRGPRISLKIGLDDNKGVNRHTSRGDKSVIKIKFSKEIILTLLLIFQLPQYYYLQQKKHLNQNKYLRMLLLTKRYKL